MRMGLIVTGFLVLALLAVSGCASWQAERNAPRHGTLVDAGGVQMHVLEIGDRNSARPPVVLIHGASANLRDMEISLGAALKDTHRVILIDRPGRGYSERPSDGYQLSRQASLIHDVLAKLDVVDPIILGQSFGGAVALNYALQYQDEMSALVVLAPVSHEWPGGVAWYNNASGKPVVGPLLRQFVIPVYGQIALRNGVDDTFAPNAAPENYVERAGLKLLFRPKDFKSNAEDIANLKAEIMKQQDRYGELTLPVIVMTGLDDDTVSPDLHSRALGREIEGVSLTLFEDTGHALHHTRTDEIAAAVLALTDPPTDQ